MRVSEERRSLPLWCHGDDVDDDNHNAGDDGCDDSDGDGEAAATRACSDRWRHQRIQTTIDAMRNKQQIQKSNEKLFHKGQRGLFFARVATHFSCTSSSIVRGELGAPCLPAN